MPLLTEQMSASYKDWSRSHNERRRRQVSWLSGQHLSPPSRAETQWHEGERLTDDSCGHSPGLDQE